MSGWKSPFLRLEDRSRRATTCIRVWGLVSITQPLASGFTKRLSDSCLGWMKLPRRLMTQKLKGRSEEHTSELQSLMRISYAVFCLKKKRTKHKSHETLESPTHN